MRRVAAVISGNSGSTRTAAALVLRASPAYLGLATKVISEGPASSIPFTPLISNSASPRSSAPSRLASSPSFIEEIVTEWAGGESHCLLDEQFRPRQSLRWTLSNRGLERGVSLLAVQAGFPETI